MTMTSTVRSSRSSDGSENYPAEATTEGRLALVLEVHDMIERLQEHSVPTRDVVTFAHHSFLGFKSRGGHVQILTSGHGNRHRPLRGWSLVSAAINKDGVVLTEDGRILHYSLPLSVPFDAQRLMHGAFYVRDPRKKFVYGWPDGLKTVEQREAALRRLLGSE